MVKCTDSGAKTSWNECVLSLVGEQRCCKPQSMVKNHKKRRKRKTEPPTNRKPRLPSKG